MKAFILGISIVLASSFAFAHDKEKSFEDSKKDSLHMVDEQMAALQTAKTCFTAAKDKDAIEACHKDLWKAEKKCKEKCKKDCKHCHKDKKDGDSEKAE